MQTEILTKRSALPPHRASRRMSRAKGAAQYVRSPKPQERIMSRSTLYRVARWLGGLSAVLLSVTTAQGQGATATVSVRVLENGTNRPIDQAQVAIAGTTIGGLTNTEGRVVIRG